MSLQIKILGAGCVKCRGLDERTRKAVAELGLDASVEKMEDLRDILNYGVLQTPALVINDQVVMSGILPTYTELKQFLSDYKQDN
jgi:small redox-active disulfide protein 2